MTLHPSSIEHRALSTSKNQGIDMASFISLPLELLIEVLHHVEFEDLVTLATMPEFEKTPAPLISFVYDSEPYPMITELPGTRISEIDAGAGVKESFLLAVISNFNESIPQLLKLEAFSDIRSSIDARLSVTDTKVTWHTEWLPRGLHSVTFHNLCHLSLSEITLDPGVLHFPVLKALTISRCHSASAKKFSFPHLTYLRVLDYFASFQLSLDFEKTPLETLDIDMINDLHTLENIHCPTLVSLILWRGREFGVRALKDLELENLEKLELNNIQVDNFTNVFFGKVTELRLDPFNGDYVPQSRYTFHKVRIPMLQKLHVVVACGVDVSDVSFPMLRTASIRLKETVMSQRNARELGSGILKKVPILVLEQCHEILFHVSAEFLRTVRLYELIGEPFDLSGLGSEGIVLPKVGQLGILTNLNALGTDQIEKIFPNVRYLSNIMDVEDGVEPGVSFPPLLTSLRMGLRGGLRQCVPMDRSLANLRVLDIVLIGLLENQPEDERKLEHFKVTGSYPQLEHLAIRCDVESITIESYLPKLKTIKIAYNTRLKHFKVSHKMDELMSITCSRGTPYIEDFNRVDAPKLVGIGQSTLLAGTGRFWGAIHKRTTRRNKRSIAIFSLEVDEWGVAELMGQ